MSVGLAIFVKTPGLSPLKTRLAASIGSECAERFHQLAAAATAEVVAALQPRITAYWAVAEVKGVDHPCWQQFPTIWQGNADLGARLDHVCAQLQARHGAVVLIGADAPQITSELLNAALRALEVDAAEFALGRANDGGFWLFGTRVPVPAAVWHSVCYSQPHTADDLLAGLAPYGAVATLPTLTDVDVADDLPLLAAALASIPDLSPTQCTLRDWLQAR